MILSKKKKKKHLRIAGWQPEVLFPWYVSSIEDPSKRRRIQLRGAHSELVGSTAGGSGPLRCCLNRTSAHNIRVENLNMKESILRALLNI